ncbi:Retrovirus-related Pol polyprotein from transposon 17.6 [Dictyocoela muelleri]|nr:Retrovirus-related Pol polyprotein from transposon 17.6 [Dictyocoela muelleri]
MEKEALGILKSMEFFKPFIIGSRIRILTDNKNLLYNVDLSKRVQRWKLLLEEFNYELKRIEGKYNTIANSISRIATLKPDHKYCYWNLKGSDNRNTLLESTNNSDLEVKTTSNFDMILDNKNRLKIPDEILYDHILKLHEDLAHPGSKKLYLTINKYI